MDIKNKEAKQPERAEEDLDIIEIPESKRSKVNDSDEGLEEIYFEDGNNLVSIHLKSKLIDCKVLTDISLKIREKIMATTKIKPVPAYIR